LLLKSQEHVKKPHQTFQTPTIIPQSPLKKKFQERFRAKILHHPQAPNCFRNNFVIQIHLLIFMDSLKSCYF